MARAQHFGVSILAESQIEISDAGAEYRAALRGDCHLHSTWSDGGAYDAQAKKLAGMFKKNFDKFGSNISPPIAEAGPKG